tara:strand:- start:41 stop:3670 length:3630 start_codon:yes stop_codon:yes gene_type:complete
MAEKNSNIDEARTPSTSPPEPRSPSMPPPARSPSMPPPARSPSMPPPVRSPSMPPPEKSPVQMKNDFEKIIEHYLESNPVIRDGTKIKELEIRFGTNPKVARPISKIEYDNVVQLLYANGFKTDNINGNQLLRIQNEYTDKRTGQKRVSNIRAEVMGTDMVQEYCKTNDLQKLINMPTTTFNKIKFTQKMPALNRSGEKINKVDMEDFNFRVSFQTEQDFHTHTGLARDILSKWDDSLKLFRALNRVQFYHDEYPVYVDISVVRSSKKVKGIPMKTYTIQEAEVFNNIEQYEVEIEIDNSRVGVNTEYDTPKKLADSLRKCIRIVLCGLQNSSFPISYKDKNTVLQQYMKLVHGPNYEIPRRIFPKDFIGPGSYTLQMQNIIDSNEDSNLPNIRKHYTVTDKADGDRKLMYVSGEGKIYLIDTNMNVQFTGVKTDEKDKFNSLIDGEHIKYDKSGKILNLYATFDIYFQNNKNVREFEFTKTGEDEGEAEEEKKTQYRINLLSSFIRSLNPYSILEKSAKTEVSKSGNTKTLPMSFKCKEFYKDSEGTSIFDGCAKILSNERDGLYEYNTDGLIFTPSRLPAGGNAPNSAPGPLYKSTWEHSFKWKPAAFNTIDFLVSVKKDNTGKDAMYNVFQEGKNLQGYQNVLQYKTLVLRCGFDEKKHGFINPFNDIIQDNIPSVDDIDDENTYKPVAFQPTNPFDEKASLCNIYLNEDGSNRYMMTEEGEYFEEDMIVEFRYVPANEEGWRWVPLRVRYDKTTELRNGMKNYGNAYHVANSNWHSIHNPITDEMISSGLNIPDYIIDDDVYYNRSNMETSTRSLRDFHNLFVKSKLITGVSNRGDTLIDYAVGKAGDLSKWIYAHLKFVLGIDISKDNIMNQLDGACSRYLKSSKSYKNIPRALFLHGDSGKNVRNGDAYYNEKDRQISKAVFGSGAKDVAILGKGVYKNYGAGESGFSVSSCQFAMHYFYENEYSMHQFMRNIAECTKVNGYFTGTCYDGKTVFNLLKDKQKTEGISIYKNNHKMFELIKMYDQTGFPDDELSLGYAINVYQETINKVFREYLVNFDYVIRIMEDYGFVLITNEEAKPMGLPSGSGLFSDLFTSMENELKMNPRNKSHYKKAPNMSSEEKRISFMNRYFVFKKVRNVDVSKIADIIKKQTTMDSTQDQGELQELEKDIEKNIIEKNIVEPPKKLKIKRTGKKITLKKFDTPMG